MFVVYIVECSDGSFYTGFTNNLEKRIISHNGLKNGAAYTRSRQPVKLIYKEEFENKSEALKREWAIKKLTHKQKQLLISSKDLLATEI